MHRAHFHCFVVLVLTTATPALLIPINTTLAAKSEPLPVMHIHLGDGIHTYYFDFIYTELRRKPGSNQQTIALAQSETKIMKINAKESPSLKAPSASISESELSHLLRIVSEHQGQSGVAIYNRHGLKIGLAGIQLRELRLDPQMMARLSLVDEDHPIVQNLTCEAVERLTYCSNAECEASCHTGFRSIFRSIIDPKTETLAGYSWILIKNK